ncbi:bifunctional phosphopantothenoylcysteine decarboxylase/phosphopantothenate--cysteine ligase CoaBC [Orrella marina]|uniref:Coenzyme A biosynthesis bifunctional protein CoaBC n=1 Tax=Orrella marina TaxID=2163011 RepID=A0A2R4XI10_9BURK|nr:bifunctional phosphopantothenoylcysteine decarboxylase/phosphopantothenate--cysteine ligase CoaBC [Orrella marina]AWB33349.1 bifunctional phosphopantothenoylcysteine decarboxylase/phosphopantothenate--cysteine ligase CoaBC [Orrella marina]
MRDLQGRHIVLGLTGGVACYKSAELVRRLIDHGATVDVVMTESACRFITPVTFQALSGRTVYTDLWDNRMANNMAHIDLTRAADVVLVAPATADFMGKLANGLADDLLTTLCMASPRDILVAPAMNREMWLAPATQRNASQLREDRVQILGPAEGSQACGEVGDGRMLEPHELLAAVIAYFQPKPLAGSRVLITAGPTCEPIDPVRVITNRSSGKTGYALAQAAYEYGATVQLVSGPTALACPPGVERIPVQTAVQMRDAVMQRVDDADIFIAVAAVADWRVENQSSEKLKKKDGQPPALHFVQNPDILAEVAARPDAPWCVGFAAETTLDPEMAQEKRRRKGVPMLIGNLAQHVMDADHTTVELFDDEGMINLGSGEKLEIARRIVQEIAQRYVRPH